MCQVRAYDPADRDGCVALLKRGHDPRFSEERFRWLHEMGPAGRSHLVLCEADSQIVGLYAVLPRAAWLDGRSIVAGRDVDPVVDPDWRGKGLFSRMLDWMLANITGVDLFYNFANRASAPGFRKRGWIDGDSLVDHVAQLSYGSLVSREGVLWAVSRMARPRTAGLPVRELEPDEVAQLPDALAPPDRRFAVCRTAAYLDWRYQQSPMHDYRILARHDDDSVVDVMVVRNDPGSRRLVVVDLAVYQSTGGSCADYFPYLERQLGVGWVAVWSTVPAAWRRGFVKSPRAKGLPLLVRAVPGQVDPADVPRAGDCFVTHGDVEAN